MSWLTGRYVLSIRESKAKQEVTAAGLWWLMDDRAAAAAAAAEMRRWSAMRPRYSQQLTPTLQPVHARYHSTASFIYIHQMALQVIRGDLWLYSGSKSNIISIIPDPPATFTKKFLQDAMNKRGLCSRVVSSWVPTGGHVRVLRRNGYSYGHSYYGMWIGNRAQAFEWDRGGANAVGVTMEAL